MARLTDTSKIENIKIATQSLVVEKGYGGASISEIAKKAKVAEGYLYRFYKGKAELVSDLLYQSINELINELEALVSKENQTVTAVIKKLLEKLFTLTNNNPEKIKFLFVLMHDYNFTIQSEQRKRIFDTCQKVKQLGLTTGELRKDITEEDIYLITVSMPIQFINLRLKSFFGETSLTEKDSNKLLNNCTHFLK